MRLKLIDAAPVETALNEVRRLRGNAQEVHAEGTAKALRDVVSIFERALAAAENPDLDDGVEVEDYARAHGITPSAVYKRIRNGKLSAKKGPGGWRIFQIAS